jgi:mono/diheme cytochrome c family protein
MKKLTIISIFAAAGVTLAACSDVKREPGRTYMPDMAYSRAYETYSVTEERKAELLKQGIHYSNMPVPGTVKRGENYTFRLTKDRAGDSTNYVASKQIVNPITVLDSAMRKESERLYLINCGICHGPNLDGNGPLWKNGDGPYPAAPKNLVSDATTVNMPEGQMFYSVTYGKGAMGSYASQLNATQRWMIIKYVKSKQAEAKGGAPSTSGAGTGTDNKTTGDSTNVKAGAAQSAPATKPAGSGK